MWTFPFVLHLYHQQRSDGQSRCEENTLFAYCLQQSLKDFVCSDWVSLYLCSVRVNNNNSGQSWSHTPKGKQNLTKNKNKNIWTPTIFTVEWIISISKPIWYLVPQKPRLFFSTVKEPSIWQQFIAPERV